MQLAPPDAAIIRPATGAFSRTRTYSGSGGRLGSQFFDVTYRPINEIEVGITKYPLRSPRTGSFLPGQSGKPGEFHVDGFSPRFVGQGRTVDEAFNDWRDRVHYAFQDLVSKRPFERSEQEHRTWEVLESQIDMPVYKNNTPITVVQVGSISRARPWPDRIEWEDGSMETVSLAQMPGPFASYKPGQWFEATVLRDPISSRLIVVSYVQRIRSPQMMTDRKADEIWRSIPTTKDLPDEDWD